MIGRYLGTLTAEQEARLLTKSFGPMYGRGAAGLPSCRCMLMVALDTRHWPWQEPGSLSGEAAYGYEYLCERFGVERVNAAIRNRILSNIARRELAGVRATVPA